jgi:hypothetical protein
MQHGYDHLLSSTYSSLIPKPSCARIIRLTRVDLAFHVIRDCARGSGFRNDRRVQGVVEYISLSSTAPCHRHHLHLQLIEQNRECLSALAAIFSIQDTQCTLTSDRVQEAHKVQLLLRLGVHGHGHNGPLDLLSLGPRLGLFLLLDLDPLGLGDVHRTKHRRRIKHVLVGRSLLLFSLSAPFGLFLGLLFERFAVERVEVRVVGQQGPFCRSEEC